MPITPLRVLDDADWPILLNNDEQGLFRGCADIDDAHAMEETLESIIDRFADCGVTALSWCLWSWFRSTGRSNVVERRRGKPCWDCWDVLFDAGRDPVEIVGRRCRERGVLFLGGLRMNDRHHESLGCAKGRFITDHPEYRIDKPEGQGLGVDYRHDAVREKVLECIADMLDIYDLDGLEFDYMRWIHMFEPGEGAEHAGKLTDFMRRSRALLDAAAERRGHGRLPLGVRLPTRLSECDHLGFDVAAWVREGLVDYLCPSCFFRTDFTVPVEQYAALAKGTDCRLYPSTHFNAGRSLLGWCSAGERVTVEMNEAQHRALFRCFAARGADGTQTYNIFDVDGERRFADVTAARDSFRGDGPREYLHAPGFFRMQPDYTPHLPTAFLRLPGGGTGELPFRACEDWSDPSLRATLRFRIVAALPRDAALSVSLNDVPVDDDALVRTTKQHVDVAYEDVLLPMPDPADRTMLRDGDNRLGVAVDGVPASTEVMVGDISLWVDGPK